MREAGPAAPGPTRVLLAPLGLSELAWPAVDPDRVRVHRYERALSAPGGTLEALADDIAGSYAGPLEIIALGSGAIVGQFLLTRHADRVRSAMLAACPPWLGMDVAEGVRDAARMAAIARDRGMTAVAAELVPTWFTTHAVRHGHAGLASTQAAVRQMDAILWSTLYEAMAASPRVDRLATVTAPVTLVAALHDRTVAIAGPVRLHALIPRSRLVLLAGPHLFPMEHPRNFTTEVARHFMWAAIGNRVEPAIATAGE